MKAKRQIESSSNSVTMLDGTPGHVTPRTCPTFTPAINSLPDSDVKNVAAIRGGRFEHDESDAGREMRSRSMSRSW